MLELANQSLQELDEIEKNLLRMRSAKLSEIARTFSLKGFEAWHERLHGNRLPSYARKWVETILHAMSIDKGTEIFAWRGSWKTTEISITFGSFYMGHHPNRANLVIGSSGQSANKITEAITSIIEFSDAWKEVFPHVVPDKEKGWGENGYEIKRVDIDYTEWVSLNSARGDPSLLGLGIGSKTLIGKHPDGLLLMDDILDEDNTASARQMSSVATKVTGTILPFIVEDETKPKGERLITCPIVIGTPWTEEDVYQDIKDTGEFVFSETPVMIECDEDEEGAVYINHEMLSGWFKLTETERYSVDSVVRVYNRSGHKEFMRMYMLDLKVKMEGEGLTFRTYPHQKIDFSEVMTVGVDYMSMIKDANVDLRNRSYYAQYYLFKLPDGRAVIGDGWYGRPTQGEAELQMEKAQSTYPGCRAIYFEGDGKGEEALQVFLRNPNLTIIPMKTEGKGKPERLERQLGPWLENGTILISDGDTPALQFLRKCLRKYPQYFKDPIDAVYWAVRGMPEVLRLEKPKDRLPRSLRSKKKSTNPWLSVGSN